MAGDPLYDTTDTVIRPGQVWYDTTTPYTYTVQSTVRADYDEIERQKKIKELLKKQIIQEMKETWNNLKNQFYPVPPVRPIIQLRGVSFGGRGWA